MSRESLACSSFDALDYISETQSKVFRRLPVLSRAYIRMIGPAMHRSVLENA